MKMKHFKLPLVAIILSLFAASSFATNPPKPTPTPIGNVTNTFNPNIKANIETSSNANAKAYSDSQALAIGQGGYSNAQGGNGGQGVGTANGFGGTSTTNVENVGNSSFSSNIPRQAPMAYAPNIQLGANAFNCANSASFGASSPFGGVSLGIPLTADNCPTFVMSQYLYNIGQPIQGCEILNNIPEIADVRRKTNFSCLAPVVVATRPAYVAPKFVDPDQDYKLNSIFNKQLQK